MKTSSFHAALFLAATAAAPLAGCGASDVMTPVENVGVLGGAPVLSFDEYVAKHVRPAPDGHGYLVERDIHMSDLDMVRKWWQTNTPADGALSVHRVSSKDDTWSRTERVNITYCVRPADFGTDYDRLVLMIQKAASGWENAADVRWVHVKNLDNSTDCTRSQTGVKYNVERNTSIGPNAGLFAGMGFPSFGRSNRYLELGRTWEWTDEELLAVLTHELGHSLGMVHEHDTVAGCTYATVDPNGYRQLTCYDGRSAMHYPFEAGWLDPNRDLNIISQWDVEGAQSVYGAPTNVINLANGTVFARQRATGDIYQRSGGNWVKIGGPGQAFVAVGNTLYGQTPGGGSPVKYTGNGWVYIGGPAGQIFPCLGTLCATVPTSGNIVKYDATANTWSTIGGPGSRFASTSTQLFGVGPWTDDYVAQYSGSGQSWSIVGGGAGELFGGGTSMYRLTNLKDAIQRYDGNSNWTTIGGAGRQFLTNGSNVYGLRPDHSFIMKYNVTQWNSIHGAAARMYGTSGYLFATSTVDESIEQYNAGANTWTALGKP